MGFRKDLIKYKQNKTYYLILNYLILYNNNYSNGYILYYLIYIYMDRYIICVYIFAILFVKVQTLGTPKRKVLVLSWIFILCVEASNLTKLPHRLLTFKASFVVEDTCQCESCWVVKDDLSRLIDKIWVDIFGRWNKLERGCPSCMEWFSDEPLKDCDISMRPNANKYTIWHCIVPLAICNGAL